MAATKTSLNGIRARAVTDPFELYLRASGVANPSPFLTEFTKLVAAMPELDADDRKAVLQIKEALFANGFRYCQSCFRVDDILTNKTGNCLGLPMLIGAIFAGLRRPPRFKVLTSILDGGFEDEKGRDPSAIDGVDAV